MPDGMTAELHGVDELLRGSKVLAGRIENEAQHDFEDVASQVRPVVAAAVPHLTGRLAGSLESRPNDEGATVGYSGAAPYDGWIEFGGTRGRPRVEGGRYLYPLALRAEPLLVMAAKAAATKEIRRMQWPRPT